MIVIMTGTMKDKEGRPLLQASDYKKFAFRTVLIFAIILGLFILINGIVLILGLYQVVTSLQDGGLPFNLDGILPSGVLPGTETLQQIQDGTY